MTSNYDQLLEQIHQLPEEEFKKLVGVLSSELDLVRPKPKQNIQQLLLKAPTRNDQQWEDYQQARNFINLQKNTEYSIG